MLVLYLHVELVLSYDGSFDKRLGRGLEKDRVFHIDSRIDVSFSYHPMP